MQAAVTRDMLQAGVAFLPSGLTIDMSALTDVLVDPATASVRFEAGLTGYALAEAVSEYGALSYCVSSASRRSLTTLRCRPPLQVCAWLQFAHLLFYHYLNRLVCFCKGSGMPQRTVCTGSLCTHCLVARLPADGCCPAGIAGFTLGGGRGWGGLAIDQASFAAV